MRVIALLPAFNEAELIVETITAVAGLRHVTEIVVIDDGSSDNTFALASSVTVGTKVTTLRLESNSGKGAALNWGTKQARGEVYLLLDADLGTTASMAEALLWPIVRNDADMTIARFGSEQSLPGAKMGFGLARRTAQLGVRWLTGKHVTSPLSGQRAMRFEVLQAAGEFFPGFGVEVGLTVGALHHGFRITEVPLAMKHRALGRGLRGIKHRGIQFFQVLGALATCWRKGWHL
jgi:glycosyltransferase involved in cell wall biosynthesis